VIYFFFKKGNRGMTILYTERVEGRKEGSLQGKGGLGERRVSLLCGERKKKGRKRMN